MAPFRSCRSRVILRPTIVYAKLLYDSRHPELLGEAERREEHLLNDLNISPAYCSPTLIDAELQDLLFDGDIPYFYTFPDSLSIWSSRDEMTEGFLKKSGWQCSMEVIGNLSKQDLSTQCDLIRSSVASLSPVLHATSHLNSLANATEDPAGEAVRVAEKIGFRLHALAIDVNNHPRWIGLTLSNSQYWTIEELGLDLYSGLPGVVLFLSALTRYTEHEVLMDLAERSLGTFLQALESAAPVSQSIGSYAGVGGIIFTLTRLHRIWPQKGLLQLAGSIAEGLPSLIDQDTAYDMVYGAAGCLAALLALHKKTGANQIISYAHQCADHLIRHGQKLESGCGWITPIGRTRPLAGFSHGNAGIAWPLAALGSLVQNRQYLECASEAVQYERNVYCPERRNWPDLREDGVLGKDSDTSSVVAWCHGASGIAFSRCNMLEQLPDDLLQEEIRIGLGSTMAHGFGGNHSLCHGDLGNLKQHSLQPNLRLTRNQNDSC